MRIPKPLPILSLSMTAMVFVQTFVACGPLDPDASDPSEAQQQSISIEQGDRDPFVKTVAWSANRLDMFTTDDDGAVYHKYWNGSAWGPSVTAWEPLGGFAADTPDAVAWGPNRLDVFTRGGADGALYHKAWDGSAWQPSVSDWEYLGGVLGSRPSVVSWSANRLDIFALGTDAAVYHKAWTGTAWAPSLTGWEPLGGKFISPPKAVSWGPNRLDIFAVGTDGALYHKAWNGSAWLPSVTGWESLGGFIVGKPEVVSWSADRLDLFVKSSDNNVYHKAWTGSAWAPSQTGWESLGGPILGSPTAVAWGPNRLDLVVQGTDSAVYHKVWNGSAWLPSQASWESLGGVIIGAPTVVSWAANRLDFFVQGTDHGLYSKVWDGANWVPSVAGWNGMGSRPRSLLQIPASGGAAWIARHGLTDAEYQTEITNRSKQGYRLTWANGWVEGNQTRYAGIWEKSAGPLQIARHGLSDAQYQTEVTAQTKAGYRLALVNGYSVGNQPQFVAIWQKDSGPPLFARPGMTESQYQTEFNDRKSAGYRLVHLSGYAINGQPMFAGIWVQQYQPDTIVRHRMTASQYQQEFTTNVNAGYRPSLVNSYSLNGVTQYAAIFERRPGLPWAARHGLTGAQYQQAFQDMRYSGYRPVVVSGQNSYAAIWDNHSFSQTDLDTIDNEAKVALTSAPAVSLAITKGGRLVFAKAYGLADREMNVPADTSSRFRIMSVSKSITAVSAMWLSEAKNADGTAKLDLEAKVFGSTGILNEYTTSATSGVRNIKVRHLLSHTSGAWGRNSSNTDNDVTKVYCRQPTLKTAFDTSIETIIQTTLDKCPPEKDGMGNIIGVDKQYDYSNFGYSLLGRILARKSGASSYEQFVKQSILQPMGITQMELGGSKEVDRKNPEVKYYGGDPYGFNIPRMDAHGGWIATPVDLARFVVRADGVSPPADILSAAGWTRMTTATGLLNKDNGGISQYGFGWANDGTFISHDGSLDGTTSDLVRSNDGFTMAAVANTRNPAPDLDGMVKNIRTKVRAWPAHDLFQ